MRFCVPVALALCGVLTLGSAETHDFTSLPGCAVSLLINGDWMGTDFCSSKSVLIVPMQPRHVTLSHSQTLLASVKKLSLGKRLKAVSLQHVLAKKS